MSTLFSYLPFSTYQFHTYLFLYLAISRNFDNSCVEIKTIKERFLDFWESCVSFENIGCESPLTSCKIAENSSKAVVQRCYTKNMFLKISQNSQENTRARVSFLTKLLAWGLFSLKCFPANFAKFLRTPFLTEHLRWLLLAVS